MDFWIGTRYNLPWPPPRLAWISLAFQQQSSLTKSLQLAMHRIISKPPQVFKAGNPKGRLSSPLTSEVNFSRTVFSSSSTSSLIFFSPSPALNRSSFSADEGVFLQHESAKQTNVAVHVFGFGVFLFFEPWNRDWFLEFLGLKRASRSCRKGPVEEAEDDDILLPDSNLLFLHSSLIRMRSPIVVTPRRIKSLSVAFKIASLSIRSSLNFSIKLFKFSSRRSPSMLEASFIRKGGNALSWITQDTADLLTLTPSLLSRK